MIQLFFLILTLLFGCNSSTEEGDKGPKDPRKIQVLCTTAQISDLAVQIGGEKVLVETLIIGEIDPHSYELVKGDEEKLSGAQIIFYNGLGLEHGASLRHLLHTSPKALAIGDAIVSQASESILCVQGQIDPHIWMDISLWAKAVMVMQARFAQEDPENKEYYLSKANELLHTMYAKDEEFFTLLQSINAKKRYLVTSHDAFHYFARRYLATDEERLSGGWEVRCKAPEGLAPEGQLSLSDLQEIVQHLCCYQIQVVFPESNVSRDALKKIVSCTAAKGLPVTISHDILYGDAMGARGSGADSYLGMMEHNVRALKRGFDNE